MYYEEQWIEGALCWRTSPDGAWTRYTANELAHRYESAEKRASDAQATVEALQARVRELEQWVQDQSTANLETMRHMDEMQSRAMDAESQLTQRTAELKRARGQGE